MNAAGAGATLDGMTIDHNGRGGIRNYGGTVALRNSTVYPNANGTTANGGGILNDGGGVLTIVNDSFWDNKGSNGAGAIANMSGSVTVLNSTFAGGSSWPAADGRSDRQCVRQRDGHQRDPGRRQVWPEV